MAKCGKIREDNVSEMFTERELQVIRLICAQASNEEMAIKLKCGIRTIEGYKVQRKNQTVNAQKKETRLFKAKNRILILICTPIKLKTKNVSLNQETLSNKKFTLF
jgi:DNA-binding CsgD family transcriptional regulator